jgi:hypothetical protein
VKKLQKMITSTPSISKVLSPASSFVNYELVGDNIWETEGVQNIV